MSPLMLRVRQVHAWDTIRIAACKIVNSPAGNSHRSISHHRLKGNRSHRCDQAEGGKLAVTCHPVCVDGQQPVGEMQTPPNYRGLTTKGNPVVNANVSAETYPMEELQCVDESVRLYRWCIETYQCVVSRRVS